MKDLTNFTAAVSGTFFEELLETPSSPINFPSLSGDLQIGNATFFELQCMNFFLRNYYPEKNLDKVAPMFNKLTSGLRAQTVIGIMRSLISDRLKLDSNIIDRLWIREGGVIVIAEKFTE